MARRNPVSARRGVLLLLVLGLLVMFGLVAITLVVVTDQHRRISEANQRIGQYAEKPESLCDQTMLSLLRGSEDPVSVIGSHGLLEDVYSNDFLRTKVRSVNIGPNAQFLNLECASVPNPERRIGNVLTMLDGPAAGMSFRIVALVNISGVAYLQILVEGSYPILGPDGQPGVASQDDNTNGTTDDASEFGASGSDDILRIGDEALVNGTPFSGTGFGLAMTGPSVGLLQHTITVGGQNLDVALLPNAAQNRNPAGGANEEYDAVDFQNMAMALALSDGRVPIPSFIRPELARYWVKRINSAANSSLASSFYGLDPDIQRMISLRPLVTHHPNFTGSNPNFNPVWDGFTAGAGQWDVDNDNDQIPDSVWIDVGLPVRSLPDGRMCKPLAAPLIVDLDGRLNVNAHGSLAQANSTYYNSITAGTQIFAGEPTSPVALPRGQGYGPAEINLLPLFSNLAQPSDRATVYGQLLAGTTTGVDGRYGESNLRSASSIPAAGLSRGPLSDPYAPQTDALSFNKLLGYPGNFPGTRMPTNTGLMTRYGALPDLKGSVAMGVDLRGQPVYNLFDEQPAVPTAGDPYAYAATNHPYELNLSPSAPRGLPSPAPTDNPFSANEAERIFRRYDRDALSLSPRLAALTSTTLNPLTSVLLDRRHEFTTESWDLPCPAVAWPRDMLAGYKPQHLIHMVDRKIPSGLTNRQQIMMELLPLEFMAGRRMDLNRIFGNGYDDNGNGVVDESEEAATGAETLSLLNANRVAQTVNCNAVNNLDVNSDNAFTTADLAMARQLYARHLYVLMMLMADQATSTAHPAWTNNDAKARWIAQWAVNVVDFMDRDSIMTRFAYDPNPWDGWSPPDAEHVVWGCERPELLITETLALHARRTEDLDTDDGVGKKTTDTPADPNFDQERRPLASLFVELFNPWPASYGAAGEFSYVSGSGWSSGVILNKTTPTSNHPVWRIIVVAAGDEAKDPDDPVAANRPTIERSVYFASPTPLGSSTTVGDGKRYWRSGVIAPLLPNRYAVIGPGGTNGATQISNLAAGAATDFRRIVLVPNADPQAADQVQMLFNTDTTGNNELPTSIQPPVGVLVDNPAGDRMSVTEPVTGYPTTNWDAANQVYNPPLDTPIDPPGSPYGNTGMITPARKIYLQRLANPLQGYDATNNPYRTIDSAPVDVFSYNGWDTGGDSASEFGGSAPSTPVFHSRERGDALPAGINNLWKTEPYARPSGANISPYHTPGQQESPINHTFPYVLQQTLGYLNRPFFMTSAGAGAPRSTPTNYVGDSPSTAPFPMVVWNNRPFVSRLELLLVPPEASTRLLDNFDVAPGASSYGVPDNVNKFLTNYLYSTNTTTTSPQLHRILELVDVPSQFVGTETQLNPAAFVSGNHIFHPPFNLVSTYREPGRMNLNTIFSEGVFDGLMNYYPGLDTATVKNRFVLSRRGYGTVGTNWETEMLRIDDTYPSRFAGPWRSFAGAYRQPGSAPAPHGLGGPNPREINATLLRADPADPSRPLFQFDSTVAGTVIGQYNDPDRNPLFRFQGLQRLGNLVTTRSNVYAVWVTVGYFEVTPNGTGIDAAHPDGYQLGAEVGSDTGEVKRHRAFYMIDRSIPVGFERGKDHNVQKTILLKRYIE